MKLSKKITSVALASVLAMSMAVSALAAGSAQTAPTPTNAPTATTAPTATAAPSGKVKDGVITDADVKDGTVEYGSAAITADVLKDAASLKTLVVTAKKIQIGKNALKGTGVKTIKALKVTKAKQVKFKGKAGKNVKLILSKKMSKKDRAKVKKAAKKAGIKKVQFK